MRAIITDNSHEIIERAEEAMFNYFENIVKHCSGQLEMLLKISGDLDRFKKESRFFNLKIYQREIKSGIASYQKLKSAFQSRDPMMDNTDIIDQLIFRDKSMLATAFFRADFNVNQLQINVRTFKSRAKLFILGVAEVLAGVTGIVASSLFLVISAPSAVGIIAGVLGVVASVSVAAKGALNIKNALSKMSDLEKTKEAERVANEHDRITFLREQALRGFSRKLSR